MKNKILTWLALSVIFCLSSFETKAQSVYIQDIIEYIDKNGQEFDALIGVRGIRYTESLNLPKVTVLEGDYIVMKATSCTDVGSVEGGHLYKLHLEIAPAMDFGERLRSHIEFTFDLEYDRWCSVDFWTVQPGLSIGEITPSEQDIAYRQSPQILTYSSDDRPSIQSVQWQQKDVYTSDWINISGANSYTYSPKPLSQTTEFRVVARSKGADIEHTEPAIVRVSPQLVGGTVSGDQTIFPDGIPLPFTNSTAAFGGSSDITYQWQAKTEQGNWTDVPNAKGLSYDPPALTTTTKFRRKAVSGEEAAYSNVVTVSVREPIAEYLSFRPIAGVVSEEDRDMRTAGLKTYEKIGILGADTDVGKFIERAFYYDYRGRIIQIVETNHLGGLSYYSTEYDFVGNILKSHELHTSDMQSASPANTADRSGSHRKLTEFTYDHRGRLLTEKTTLDDNEPVTVSYAYDPLGELRSKRMGADLLVETYEYNLQGWRTNHTVSAGADTLFETKLHYYEPRFEGTTPTYTGNISEWEWQHGTDAETNAYAFAYDRAARLVETKQYIDGVGSDGFVEKGITYDSNGNIQTLSRTAAGSETENYRYTYAGNRMTQLHDSTTGASHSFAYDANGNMIRDGANNLDMTYNSTDLLKNVEQGGAILAKYSYLADGRKLTATESAGNGLCYLGSLVYRTQNGTFDLESASFGGGRLVVSSEGLETRYFLTDHLGSVRQVVAADGSVIEQNDYYPFGKRWAAVAAPISDNRHRFSGKEEQAFLSLPYVDFGARMYNPDWGRWFTQDPLLEKYYPIGQYCYCAGNPIRFSDKKGQSIKDAVVGYAVGFVTNIIPGTTGLRDSYTPTDAVDYNNALQTTDLFAGVAGVTLSESGEGMMITGTAVGSLAASTTMATAGASAEVTVPLAAVGKTTALVGLGAKTLGVTLMGNSAKNVSQGYNRGKEKVESSKSSTKSINQLNRSLKNKNKGNKNIKRFDKGKIKGEQDHVHFDDGAALNKDGSWKHGQRELTQEERNYLQENGWTIE